MDKIQKTLIKAGHKDLADEYFERISSATFSVGKLKKELSKFPNNLEVNVMCKGFGYPISKIENTGKKLISIVTGKW